MDSALLGAALLLTTASIFGRLQGPWTGGKSLLDPGDRVAAGMLAMGPIAIVVHRLCGSLVLSLMSPLVLYVYVAVLAIHDRSTFSRALLIGMSAVYVAMLIAFFVSGTHPPHVPVHAT